MTFIKINDKLFPGVASHTANDREWGGREAMVINAVMTYQEAAELFVNDAEWFTVIQPNGRTDENGETIIPDPTTHDQSEYCVAGDITDHRDGTLTIKMGKLTDLEETLDIIYGGIE